MKVVMCVNFYICVIYVRSDLMGDLFSGSPLLQYMLMIFDFGLIMFGFLLLCSCLCMLAVLICLALLKLGLPNTLSLKMKLLKMKLTLYSVRGTLLLQCASLENGHACDNRSHLESGN
ncbi:hypothetical protein C5167_042248 [Papaver somniferum]|uniref:Uncharacterized protein n=1 Tax=Papaver somniferum TaxID=3469 RepID=A0A4Y7L2B0_PAPSO|nr:hypothetical protein C5167_042248 [Papaver somniferum]